MTQFKPTLDQKQALEEMLDWYSIPFEQLPVHTLSGGAGTGKSFTLTQFLKQVGGLKVALAPTHKAKGVLNNFFEQAGVSIKVETIHSALGYVVSENIKNFKKKGSRIVSEGMTDIQPINDHKIPKKTKLIVVDEASMVDVDLEKHLLGVAKDVKCKVLWVGDPYQLKPPGKIQCGAFDSPSHSILREVVRYSGGSLKIATVLRENMHKPNWKPTLRQLYNYQLKLDEELHNVFLMDEDDWEHELQKACIDGRQFTVLAFRNEKVIKYNNLVRKFKNRDEEIMVGDKLISLKPNPVDHYNRANKHVPKVKGRGGRSVPAKFINGELAEVVKTHDTTIDLYDAFSHLTLEEIENLSLKPKDFWLQLVMNGKPARPHAKKVREVVLSSTSDVKKNNVTYRFLDPNNLGNCVESVNANKTLVEKLKFYTSIMYTLDSYVYYLLNRQEEKATTLISKQPLEISEAVVDLYETTMDWLGQDHLARVLTNKKKETNKIYSQLKQWENLSFLTYHWNYADACSIHKSQGSSFDTVFMDGADIMSAGMWRNLLYVGLTRSKGNVYIRR